MIIRPATGEVDTAYTNAVGKRFAQWVIDTAKAEYDQAWLDYQYEIGLRHHRSKKNKTDAGHTLGHIRARDLIAFSAAIVVPMMILQVALWSQPYIREGDFLAGRPARRRSDVALLPTLVPGLPREVAGRARAKLSPIAHPHCDGQGNIGP